MTERLDIIKLMEEIKNTVIPKIETLTLTNSLNKKENITLSNYNLELVNKNDKCSRCERDARYLEKDNNIFLCWNHCI